MADDKNISDTINQFIERQSQLSFLNDFDKALLASEMRLPARNTESPAAQLAWALHELSRNHFFMMHVGALKLVEIAKGICWAVEAKNPTVHISLARSLFEHTAALAFQIEKLNRIHEDLSRQGDLPKLLQAILRHQSVVERIFYGQSPQRPGDHIKQFHINDFREALRKDYPDEASVYDTLCDFVHPNYGSNHLVSSGTLGTGTLHRPASAYAYETGIANSCATRCLELANKYAVDGSVRLIGLDSRIQMASKAGGHIGAVFSEKGLSHEGDGRTKETALCFKKARTHFEAVEMIYRYLEAETLVQTGPRQNLGFDGGFLYELYQTNGGPLWVKTKMAL